MHKVLIVSLLTVLLAVGCNMATTADLLSYDLQAQLLQQTKISVAAYDQALRTQMDKDRVHQLRLVQADIADIGLGSGGKLFPPENVKANAARIASNINGFWSDQMVQERRRANLWEVTNANLDYGLRVAERSKQFQIFKMDVGMQFKRYLNSVGSKVISAVAPQPAPPPPPAPAPVPEGDIEHGEFE